MSFSPACSLPSCWLNNSRAVCSIRWLTSSQPHRQLVHERDKLGNRGSVVRNGFSGIGSPVFVDRQLGARRARIDDKNPEWQGGLPCPEYVSKKGGSGNRALQRELLFVSLPSREP